MIKLTPFTPQKFHRRVFSQLWMLALQFFLGMILTLINEKVTGTYHIIYISILIMHILNAVGLVEGGIYIALKEQSKLSWWSTAALGVAFVGGIVQVVTHQDIWSFVMACGFLGASWLYVMLYIQADRRLYSKKNKK